MIKIKKLLLIITLTLALCGCKEKDPYAEYEHYNLNNKNPFTYSFYDDKGQTFTYALSILENDNYEDMDIGLFFKVGKDDYILLDKENTCNEKEINNNNTYFYNNLEKQSHKLYLERCIGNKTIEYTLNEEKIEKKELNFDKRLITSNEINIIFNKINKVENNYIYYIGYDNNNISKEEKNIKCSLIDYSCIIENDK